MFGAFLAACSCVYVPYRVTDTLGIDMPKPHKLGKAIAKYDTVVVLSVKRQNARLVAGFTDMQALFPDVHFMFAPYEIMKEHMNKSIAKGPCLTIIRNEKVEVSVGPFWDETTMVTMIDLYLTKKRPVITDKVELVAALGGAPRTIVAFEEDFNKALDYITQTSKTHGPANIVLGSPELFEEMAMARGTCALFRREDDTLEPIEGCTLENYKKVSVPVYYKTGQMLDHSKQLVVALKARDADRDEGVASILPQLKGFFPNMEFVIADDHISSRIDSIQGDNWSSWNSNVAVINFHERYFYNLTSNFTAEMKKLPFDPLSWGNLLAQVLLAIKDNAMQRVYMSEPVTPPTNNTLQIVCGDDYLQRLNDTEHDQLIVYTETRSRKYTKHVEKLKKVARALEKNNNTNYRFLIIDVAKNSVPGGFPVTAKGTPLLGFVSKDNKKLMPLLPCTSSNVVKWFLKRYASVPHTLNFTMPSADKIARIAKKVDVLSVHVDPIAALSLKKALSDLRADASPETSDEL